MNPDIRRIMRYLGGERAVGLAALVELVQAQHPTGCSGMNAHRPCHCGKGCSCKMTPACVGLADLASMAETFTRTNPKEQR